MTEVPFRCNVEGCNRKPYMELFDMDNSTWSYVCYWHYIKDRLKKKKNHGYCRVDSEMEILIEIRDDIFEIQCDIDDIKKSLRKKK